MDSPPVDVKSWTLSKLAARAHDVKRGVRNVASVMVSDAFAETALGDRSLDGLHVKCRRRGEHHVELFLFKLEHIDHVLDCLFAKNYHDELFQDWMWGHLFGYGEQEIGEHIKKI